MRARWSLLWLALAPLPLLAVDYRMQASVAWAENYSRTSHAPTIREATIYTAHGFAAHARQLNSRWLLLAELDAGFEHVPDYRALDQVNAHGQLTLRRKFGLGPMAPVVDLSAGVARVAFREHGRSGWRSEATLAVSKRLTPEWRIGASGSWEKFDASHTTFDIQHRRFAVETHWHASERLTLSAGAARQWGRLVANAAWPIWSQAIAGGFGPVVSSYYNSIPWEISHTFGPGWVAYRVDCTADFWWTEASFTLNDRTRIPLRYESARVVNRIDVRYNTSVVSLGVLHRF
ncbi:MAG: hypothetical protein Q8M02_05100 [Candidatus Didemnitutus sp.]|nr:hypothetical protein [Candidatus Didemnitutus sp.]